MIMAVRAAPVTFWLGLLLIAACEGFLWFDVQQRGGAIVGPDQLASRLPTPIGNWALLSRWVAVNLTALCWIGHLLVCDGLLTTLSRRRQEPAISPIRARPNRFLVTWLVSVPVWCMFDAFNFYCMGAWQYHGLPPQFAGRLLGYFIAFAAIGPGMFLVAELLQQLGLNRLCAMDPLRSQRLAWGVLLGLPMIITAMVLGILICQNTPLSKPTGIIGSGLLLAGPTAVSLLRKQSLKAVSFAIGVSFVIWTALAADPISNLTLWVGLIFLLDPINDELGGPSLLADWKAGRWGRTMALMAGGAICGLLWEFWNYWAIAKWTYDLPFLGLFEPIRYFEMPLLGFFGFLPFAIECWIMTNLAIGLLNQFNFRVAEPLPDLKNTAI